MNEHLKNINFLTIVYLTIANVNDYNIAFRHHITYLTKFKSDSKVRDIQE
jgi:hypothetical protein